MKIKLIKLFLRVALAAGFISAVADRWGWWPADVSVWGNWAAFETYTAVLNPWAPAPLLTSLAAIATGLEVVLALCLLVGFKTRLTAICSGVLLLLFGLSMCVFVSLKSALDYSVFSASAAAFALSAIKIRFLEIDNPLSRPKAHR